MVVFIKPQQVFVESPVVRSENDSVCAIVDEVDRAVSIFFPDKVVILEISIRFISEIVRGDIVVGVSKKALFTRIFVDTSTKAVILLEEISIASRCDPHVAANEMQAT